MTRKIIILAYILGILLLSGMVKASETQVSLVKAARINPNGMVMAIGRYQDNCQANAQLHIQRVDYGSSTIYLDLTTEISNGGCGDVVKDFQSLYNLKTLQLQVGATYRVVIQGFINPEETLIYHATPSTYNAEDFQLGPSKFKGTLVNYQDGFALQRGNDLVPLVAKNLSTDSNNVKGEVRITGFATNSGIIPMSIGL